MSSMSVRSAREREDLHVLASHLVALLQEHEVGLERPVYDALRALKSACEREPFSGIRPAGDVRAIVVLPLGEAAAICAAARIGMCADALERHWDVGHIDTRSTGRALHAVAGAIDVAVERDAAWRRLAA